MSAESQRRAMQMEKWFLVRRRAGINRVAEENNVDPLRLWIQHLKSRIDDHEARTAETYEALRKAIKEHDEREEAK